MKVFAFQSLTRRSHVITAIQSRWISVTAFQYMKKKQPETLMPNAPDWDQADATESEQDVKADLAPEVDPKTLKRETVEWIESHIDDDGNIIEK